MRSCEERFCVCHATHSLSSSSFGLWSCNDRLEKKFDVSLVVCVFRRGRIFSGTKDFMHFRNGGNKAAILPHLLPHLTIAPAYVLHTN